uniref:GSTe2 n=1 Tax=Paracoccus marginatus TaxID=252483 RepID=A0AA51N3G2_9HEMI|nr:GSTe2 [Paracoccus marginatus]
MSLKLYCTIFSPPVRAVMHTLKALNIPYTPIEIDLPKGETYSKEYRKINPQHTVPTIEEEDGFILWDSHAINSYLVDKYGKDDKLYPKDLRTRALVHQRLYFDSSVLFTSFLNTSVQIIRNKNIPKLTEGMKFPIDNAYGFVEKFLSGRQYIAGDNITIADFSILTCLTNLDIVVPITNEKYPLIKDYVKRGEANIPTYKELEKAGRQKVIEVLKSCNFQL